MIGTKGVPAKWGGIEVYIEEIGKRLVDRGHDVTVFSSRWFTKDYNENTYCGMRIRRVPALHYQATDAMSNAFFSTLLIAKEQFDLVNFHGYASYYFVPIIKMMRKKTIVTSHGLVDSAWQNPKYSGFSTSIIRHGGGIGIRNADCVITVADHWRRRIMEVYNRNAHVISSGINEAIFRHPDVILRKYGLLADSFILFLGRIDPIKRIDWVVRLSKVCGSKKIVIAGGAQDEITQAYMKTLRKISQKTNKVIFTGPVADQEKAELLSNCSLLINPSQSEGLPVVVLEGMSYARCCIASNIDAHKEVLRDGYNGFLFPSQQEDALAALVARLAKDESKRSAVGKAAKETVEGNYSWEHTALLTEQVFQEAINEL